MTTEEILPKETQKEIEALTQNTDNMSIKIIILDIIEQNLDVLQREKIFQRIKEKTKKPLNHIRKLFSEQLKKTKSDENAIKIEGIRDHLKY